MEKTIFHNVIGMQFKNDNKDIEDPWTRLSAAILKRAIYELLSSRRKSPNQEVLIWLRSDEAALMSEVAGISYSKIRSLVDQFAQKAPKRDYLLAKYKIRKFEDRWCTYKKEIEAA